MDYHNISSVEGVPNRPPDAPCLDSSQNWFCRDLWIQQAGEGVREVETMDSRKPMKKRRVDQDKYPVDLDPPLIPVAKRASYHGRRQHKEDPDANVGSDFDAMPDTDDGLSVVPTRRLSVPNSVFRPARILINPRCVTTYAGVSHTQLALDLFGPKKGEEESSASESGDGKYTLDDWEGAPESFVCQEQKYAFSNILMNMGWTHFRCTDPPEAAVPLKLNGGWASPFTRKLTASRETNLCTYPLDLPSYLLSYNFVYLPSLADLRNYTVTNFRNQLPERVTCSHPSLCSQWLVGFQGLSPT